MSLLYGLQGVRSAVISQVSAHPVPGTLEDNEQPRCPQYPAGAHALRAAYPALPLLAHAPSFVDMLLDLLWLSFMYGLCDGTACALAASFALYRRGPVSMRPAA